MRTPIFAMKGDIFFTRSNSLLGRLIRWAESDPNEPNGVWANHVGIVVESGWIVPPNDGRPAQLAKVVEALWETREWEWWTAHQAETTNAVRVYRRRMLDSSAKEAIVAKAREFVGRKYGYWKLGAHLFDRLVFRGKKVTSNLLHMDTRPICSYLVAVAFAMGGVFFGLAPQAADPDELEDSAKQDKLWEFVGESSTK